MQKIYKSIRVFKSPILEKFTHVHPLTPLVLWGPMVGWLIWRSLVVHQLNSYYIGALGFMGILVWTLMEYLLHRFLFHYKAESPIGQRLHFLIHGLHHQDPLDPTRLVMPPVAAIFLALLLFSLFRSILGPIWVEPFFAFFLIGYLCYDYIHFYIHHFVPKTRIGKFLKQSHMVHHYVDPDSHWGVSSPLWDFVFGTWNVAKEKKRAV